MVKRLVGLMLLGHSITLITSVYAAGERAIDQEGAVGFSHRHSGIIVREQLYEITPLMLAANCGDARAVAFLVKLKAPVDVQETRKGWTALMYAVQSESVEAVDVLLKVKAAPNMQAHNGNTALVLAVQRGFNDMVSLLLNAKASVDLENKDGITALMCARTGGYQHIVEQLTRAEEKE